MDIHETFGLVGYSKKKHKYAFEVFLAIVGSIIAISLYYLFS